MSILIFSQVLFQDGKFKYKSLFQVNYQGDVVAMQWNVIQYDLIVIAKYKQQANNIYFSIENINKQTAGLMIKMN